MEFGGFDDDLFEDEGSEKAQVPQESNWTVHISKPGVSCAVVLPLHYIQPSLSLNCGFCHSGFTIKPMISMLRSA